MVPNHCAPADTQNAPRPRKRIAPITGFHARASLTQKRLSTLVHHLRSKSQKIRECIRAHLDCVGQIVQ